MTTWHISFSVCPYCDSEQVMQTSLPEHLLAAATIDCLRCGTQFSATVTVRRLASRRVDDTSDSVQRDMTAPGAALIEALMQRGTP